MFISLSIAKYSVCLSFLKIYVLKCDFKRLFCKLIFLSYTCTFQSYIYIETQSYNLSKVLFCNSDLEDWKVFSKYSFAKLFQKWLFKHFSNFLSYILHLFGAFFLFEKFSFEIAFYLFLLFEKKFEQFLSWEVESDLWKILSYICTIPSFYSTDWIFA